MRSKGSRLATPGIRGWVTHITSGYNGDPALLPWARTDAKLQSNKYNILDGSVLRMDTNVSEPKI
jgi:hypothetical protein